MPFSRTARPNADRQSSVCVGLGGFTMKARGPRRWCRESAFTNSDTPRVGEGGWTEETHARQMRQSPKEQKVDRMTASLSARAAASWAFAHEGSRERAETV